MTLIFIIMYYCLVGICSQSEQYIRYIDRSGHNSSVELFTKNDSLILSYYKNKNNYPKFLFKYKFMDEKGVNKNISIVVLDTSGIEKKTKDFQEFRSVLVKDSFIKIRAFLFPFIPKTTQYEARKSYRINDGMMEILKYKYSYYQEQYKQSCSIYKVYFLKDFGVIAYSNTDNPTEYIVEDVSNSRFKKEEILQLQDSLLADTEFYEQYEMDPEFLEKMEEFLKGEVLIQPDSSKQ